MTDFSNAMTVATSGMKAQSARLRHVSENIANSDTPGYRRKTVSFSEIVKQGDQSGAVQTSRVHLDQTALEQIYDPTNPLSDETGNYSGSNVKLLIEVADAREAQRSYEANLKMFDQIKQMSTALMELLRK